MLRDHLWGPKPRGAHLLDQARLLLSSLAALAIAAVYRGTGAYSAADSYLDAVGAIGRSAWLAILRDVSDAPDGAPPSGNAKTRSTPSRDDGVERSTLMHMLQVLRCSCSCSCSSHVLMLLLLLLLPLLRLMA